MHLRDSTIAVLLFAGTFAMVFAAGVGARRVFDRPDPRLQPRLIPDWEAYAGPGHGQGEPEAPAVLVVFASYTCGECGRLHRSIRRVEAERVLWVVRRHFPGPRDTLAWAAAGAAECADEQGRFPEYEDALYDTRTPLDETSWEPLARRAGVPDLARFQACVSTQPYRSRVARDVAAADALELLARPSLLINETLLSGLPSDTLLNQLLALAAFTGRSPR